MNSTLLNILLNINKSYKPLTENEAMFCIKLACMQYNKLIEMNILKGCKKISDSKLDGIKDK